MVVGWVAGVGFVRVVVRVGGLLSLRLFVRLLFRRVRRSRRCLFYVFVVVPLFGRILNKVLSAKRLYSCVSTFVTGGQWWTFHALANEDHERVRVKTYPFDHFCCSL